MQKKSKHTSVKAQDKSLSVQFSLDGFSFCIQDNETQKPISFTKYVFDETLSPELLLEKVTVIFSSDKDLQQEFVSIKAIHQNNLATLVPNKYFDESKLKTYLDYNIKTLVTDFIAYDNLEKTTAKNVYVPYININNYLFQNFGEFEYKHHATELIDNLILYSEEKNHNHFYVHVCQNNFDIVTIKDQKLQLYNNFAFNTKEDFIYYILFTAEQLGLNPDEFELTLLGDIQKDSEIYAITYNYVRNISFLKPKSDFFITSQDFLPYTNFLLIN